MPVTINGTTGIAGVDGSASTPSVQGSDTNTGEFFPAADTIAWTTGGSERMRVNSSGDVGIGTSSPSYKFEVNSGSNAYSSRMTSTTANALLAFGDSGTTSIGPFVGSAGNALTFGRGGVAEYARIDSSGNLLVGTTSLVGTEKFSVSYTGNNFGMYALNASANPTGITYTANLSSATGTNSTTPWLYFGSSGGTTRFVVYGNGGIANFQANNANLSDSREKKNIELSGNYLEKICAIPVKTFLYNDQLDTDKNLGVIAQDVQAVAPELVSEEDWSPEKDGSKMRLSIYQTDLQYALMKCIQELSAKVDAQAAEIAALKANAPA